jgi:NAD(P)-dependent dehydrogenase (short-subunit alcohol dehydrogenase family)
MSDNSPGDPLAGKTVLITGGARRIGRAIALRLASAGATIAFSWRNSREDAFELERQLLARGARAIGIQADLMHESAVAQMLQTVEGAYGRLDVLVNNAGRYEDVPFEDITAAQWDEMLATNLKAPFLASKLAAPLLRRHRDGRIINISSIGAVRPFPSHAHYCASKAGLDHLTRTMARALAPDIAVNGVAPGLISLTSTLNDWERHMEKKTPMRRTGSGDDVAEAVLFFATCTRFITGQVLLVDGGLSLA